MFLKRNYSMVIIIFVILGVSFLLLGVFSKVKDTKIQVKVSKAQLGSIQSYIDTKVIIKSKFCKEYYGNQQQVKKIYVRPGTYVEKDQKLISFDTSDLLSQYTQAQIQLENSILQKNQMILSRENFDRQRLNIDEQIIKIKEEQEDNESFIEEVEESFEDSRILSSKNNISKASEYNSDVDRLIRDSEESKRVLLDLEKQRDSIPEVTNEQIRLLDNAVILAENTLRILEEKIKSLEDLKADFSGVVTNINITEGSYSQPGSVILVIQDTQSIKGIALISQQNVSKVKTGQSVSINDPLGNFEGVIASIGELAVNTNEFYGINNVNENALIAEIDIINPNERLKIDFDLNGKILLNDATDILKIPIECIMYDEKDIPYVFLIKENSAFKTNIVHGNICENYVQILEGVNQGDSVVVNPPSKLLDKSKVKVVGMK